jgi:hypothetical protein
VSQSNEQAALQFQLRQVLDQQNLVGQRADINAIAGNLGVSLLDCAAALAYLFTQTQVLSASKTLEQTVADIILPNIKMVRYRLEVGSKHHCTLDSLIKVLVEESGVDKNNIQNVNIQGDYTIIELPEGMPADIFVHLKTVEIGQKPLEIKRLKSINKKRRNFRRGRQRKTTMPGAAESAVLHSAIEP